MVDTLSLPAARRIALAAQGFAVPRPTGALNWGHLGRVLERTQLLQIDSVNVLARAHYLPLFSRLGAYDRTLLEAAAWHRPRRLFEFWGHEASLIPIDRQPLFRWRMADAERGVGIYGGLKLFAGERRPEAERVLAAIAANGPMAAAELEKRAGKGGGWWGWSDAKAAVEWLFWSGQVMTRTRRGAFERVYDLTERVLPRAVLDQPTPTRADAQRALLARAARALGVATATDLRDYFRLKPSADPHIGELVETGELIPVAVESWRQPAYLHREARRPRRIEARALLSPFDPVVWERARTERLFAVRYRIEIYTPVEKRLHGYYVLPFLLGDRLVARVDLKADRARRALQVQNAHAEPFAPADTAAELADELRLLAQWLGLESIEVLGTGDLVPALSQAIARREGRQLPPTPSS